jgi:hypothetical protein
MAKIPQSIKEQSSEEFLPSGDYTAVIMKTEMKTTNAGDGEYLSLAFKVVQEGFYKDRLVYTNLNLVNPNPVAVNIAVGTLDKICKACNLDRKRLDDSDELLNIPIIITVTRRPDDDAYPGNDIKGFKKATSSGTAPKKNPFQKN